MADSWNFDCFDHKTNIRGLYKKHQKKKENCIAVRFKKLLPASSGQKEKEVLKSVQGKGMQSYNRLILSE